jgi:beta-lactamase class A
MEWIAIVGVVGSIGLMVFNLIIYSSQRERLPAGMVIAGVPVGRFTRVEAQAELARVYSTPVELHYRDSVFDLDPAQISFRLDSESMLARADTYRTESSFWAGFWNYLWSQPGKPVQVNLSAEYSQEQLRQFLRDAAARYDSPPSTGMGDALDLTFGKGQPGYALDIESSLTVVDFALHQPTNRRVALTLLQASTARPAVSELKDVLQQYLSNKQFKGIASVVAIDAKTGAELVMNGGVAFSGMGSIKIPLIAMNYWKWDADPPADLVNSVGSALLETNNISANALLRDLGDGNEMRGAQLLTQQLKALGLQNTFLAGPFDQSSNLERLKTPANQRTDLSTNPDPYVQTTADDMASFLLMLYQCASTGGGPFAVVLPGRISQSECQTILGYLAQNRTGVQIEGGVPAGVRVAHKEGLSDNTYGDAGIVFSPATDYIVVEYIWTQDYLNWDYGQPLMADMSKAVYNYFNGSQAAAP